MKKHLLTFGCMALLSAGSMAQNFQASPQPIISAGDEHQHQPTNGYIRCGSTEPGAEWDKAFNALVDKYKADLQTGKASSVSYTIAVIVHVIHNNETVGGTSSYNLSQAQINSQITILNADFAGTNSDVSLIPATFQGVKANNCDITFCMAQKDPLGNTLAEPGIERINRNTKGWSAPPYTQTYIDGTVKPNSIWDPTKYLNMWICNLGGGLLGYATFPVNSGLGASIPGGGNGGPTNDGVVMLASAFGNIGFQATSQYNKGRTTTHEVGHWLGLRHIWGDGGGCATDYCNDTPVADVGHGGCISPSPYHVNQCGAGTAPNGEMTMNYMDYTDDACMYMFTNDQRTRVQTCMANGTYRTPLTGNAVTICNATVLTPTANFTYPTTMCAQANIPFTDASSGPPTGWAWSVAPTTGVVITTASSQNPTINFPAAGTYTVSLSASNSQGSNSTSQVVTITACAGTCDTLSNINNTDTLAMYNAAAGGYWTGTNGYPFTDIAEFYQKTQFATNLTNVTGGIILFYKNGVRGTKGTGTVTLTMNAGPTTPGAVLATKAFTINTATATTAVQGVPYAGNPALQFGSAIIIPYVAMFTTPGALTADFFMALTVPTGGTDTIAVLTGRRNHSAPLNTAWIKYGGNWMDLKTATTGTANPNGSTYNIGIIPIACPTTGMQDNSYLGHNINLFPNPTSGYINFAVALGQATDLQFTILNTLGQTVSVKTESNFTNGVLTYDLSNLPKGVYFAHITDKENNKTVKKILIE